MAHPLLFDATWLQQGKYESAEAYYQQILTGGGAGASPNEENKTKSESKPPTETQSKAPVSSIKSEIAEARQNIQNALKEETAVPAGQAGGDPEIMNRIQGLESENNNLKKASQDLQALVKKLEARVSALEKGSSTPALDTKPSPAAKETKKDDDDDDDFEIDFSDDEEEEDKEEDEEKKKRLEAYYAKKEKKPTVIAKSNLILDVKPWSDDTDMPELEKCVRSIAMDGLLWGASKLVPVGYGIRKLQISCVIVDDKVSTDAIEEEITAFEDFVQSMDIAAFNKV